MRVRVSYEQVQEAVGLVGLPEATDVQPVGRTWVHANFKVDLKGGGAVLLRCRTLNPGWDTLLNELSALNVVPDGVPVVPHFTPLPVSVFGRPAALSTYVPGEDGGTLASTEAGRAQLATHIGSTIRALQTKSFANHGTVGLGHGFSCRAATWREEWTLLVEEAWARAEHVGLTLGDVGPAVLERFRAQVGQLDDVDRFTLVHRDLHGNNLRVGDEGALAAVIDWSDALIGDPQVEWASLTDAPPDHFDAIHAAAGSPPLDRLPLYDASRAIQRLGFCSLALFDHDRGYLRAVSIERALLACRRVLEGTPASLDHSRVAVRRAAEALRQLPGVRPHVGMSWLGGMASALAGDEAWSSALIDRVDTQEHARPFGASDAETVTRRVLEGMPEAPQGALAIGFVALAREADARLDGTLGPRVWAGVAEVVEGLLRMEHGIALPDIDRQAHALLGRAACRVLGAPEMEERFGLPMVQVPPRPPEPKPGPVALLPALEWAQQVLSR